jgi:L-amino acid N-acyltransferase YncA
VVSTDIRIRRIQPDDADELERFYAGLSPASRAQRFHGASRGIGHDTATRFATADHCGREGFVATEGERIVGHLVLEPFGAWSEEVAIVVSDGHQHHGVGSLLMAAAFASARLRGIERLVAWVGGDNAPMQRLLVASHYPLEVTWDGSVARYEVAIPPPPRSLRRAA